MEALDIVMKTLDKKFLDRFMPMRRGPKGHEFYKIIRLFVMQFFLITIAVLVYPFIYCTSWLF